MSTVDDKAVRALKQSLELLKKQTGVLVDCHTVHDPVTHTPLLETLEDDVRGELEVYDEAISRIEDALCVPSELRAGGRFGKRSFLHNPRAYGVTVTVDVLADNMEEATEAFIEDLGISNPEALTFLVEHLNTGRIAEL